MKESLRDEAISLVVERQGAVLPLTCSSSLDIIEKTNSIIRGYT